MTSEIQGLDATNDAESAFSSTGPVASAARRIAADANVTRALSGPAGGPVSSEPVIIQTRADDLARLALRLIHDQNAHFTDLFADRAGDDGGLTLRVVLALPQAHDWRWVILLAPVDANRFAYPALTPELPLADWYERELWDEAGVTPSGHPALARLRLPASWPREHFPLLRQRALAGAVPEATSEASALADDERPNLEEAPEGIVEYPLGPVRSGVVESGHYTLRTVGEEIVDFRLQLFYKHRGVEQRATGLTPMHLPLLAERISGTSGFAHALATCETMERIAGVTAPPRAQYLRVLFAELERLYNHLGYHADLCQATGLVVGQAQLDILKERVLRLNALLTGHRYLFGACVFGGVAYDPPEERLREARTLMTAIRTRMRRLGRLLMDSPSHVDRLEGTGILAPEDALALGMVGPNARASGVDRDVRRDHPYAAYGDLAFDVPVQQAGDALARARVRLDEIAESVRLLDQVLTYLATGANCGPVRVAAAAPLLSGAALGWVESPRGEASHWMRFDDDGRVARYRVRPASFANAQAFPLCVPGRNILTDFPVIEQSWGLSFAGVDR
jgi:Ni,Fe-hydrogenase III large subunit/Ni,Fe-hydrogenase III component G